jgi:xylulokinase
VLIAHDIGTTGDKASLHDTTGRLIASTTARYGTHYDSGGVVEQNPEDWWHAFIEATRSLLEQTGTKPEDVTAVGVSGQMMGAVMLDRDHNPVRPALIWADTRSQQQCAALIEQIGQVEAYALLGHRLNPTYSLTKVMWVREHEPELFARTSQICQAKDFVAARLTGRLATDPSDASSTNAFDQRAGAWAEDILAEAGVPLHLWPEIVPSTTVLGTVTTAAAAMTGLLSGTPVVLGGGDGPMAATGVGITEPDDGAYAYLGSSSWVSVASTEPLLDLPDMRTMTFNHIAPGRFVPTATMQSGGGALQWIADVLTSDAEPDRFTRLVTAADGVLAADEGLFFLPHLLGERSPWWNPNARGAFVGVSRHHGQAHLTRAVLEGVAFNLATCVGAFRENGTPVARVDAIGGGAASPVWLQILADVWGSEVRQRTIVDEANSLGAAVTTGVAVGTVADLSAAKNLSQISASFHPDPERHEAYQGMHARFLEIYAALEPTFDKAAT